VQIPCAVNHSARSRLTFLSLVILAETADNAGAKPVDPSLAVRLALAYLYSIANTDRRNFDQFWQTLRDPMKAEHSDVIRAHTRPTFCRTHLTGIARSVGVELTVEVGQDCASAEPSGCIILRYHFRRDISSNALK
jgi:hypothetical protein